MNGESEILDCRRLRRMLGAVLEGEAAPEALAHLNACPRCRLLAEEVGAIGRAASELPACEPTTDLWPRIRRAAEMEGLLEASWTGWLVRGFGLGQPPALAPAYGAAVVALLVAAVLLVGYPSLDVGPAREEAASRAEIARSELALAPDYSTRYALHLDRIADTVREEVAPADVQLVAVAHTNLDTLDRCIRQCQKRLASYPEDEFTQDELNRLYQQKATLLQAMLDPDWQTPLR